MTINLTDPQEPVVSELPTDDERIMEASANEYVRREYRVSDERVLLREYRTNRSVWIQCSKQAYECRKAEGCEVRELYERPQAAMLNADGTLTNEDTKLDGWISVSERMPPEGEYVSVVSRHGEYVSGLVGGEWLELHDGTSFGLDEIVLWMMLPSLPAAPQDVK